ncbi:unnamed protein product [Owenia fusiformis]|uniref:Uncharacterized protein n=1 Tax=Owenia fusiformis TaxID=6347 RepID=A0A8J1U2B2_OWEFU|nr:unnamed protein product [Owenia fusiformis]
MGGSNSKESYNIDADQEHTVSKKCIERSFSSDVNEIECEYAEMMTELKARNYDNENLVLEGGGTKGLAYCGTITLLEELDIIKNLKRFAGASSGAMLATLLAVGFSAAELEVIVRRDARSSEFFQDAKFGILSLPWNMIKHQGWHPYNKIESQFELYIEEKQGKRKLTFLELYQKTGKELCIIATNLTTSSVEYFHPKTTPNVSIALAVRISIGIPGFVQPKVVEKNGLNHCYIDGGVLCNYPIHCFDGWYLSMDPKDSFFRKLENMTSTNKEHTFGGNNDKTLGLLLYSGDESEFMMQAFEERSAPIVRPNTKLARKNGKIIDEHKVREQKRIKIFEAAKNFWMVLRSNDVDGSNTIDIHELQQAIEHSDFKEHHAKALFGDTPLSTIFKEMDINGDGEVTFDEFITFMEKKSVHFMCYMQNMSVQDDTNTIGGFLSAFQGMLDINLKKLYMKSTDVARTIGINTDYVKTTDMVYGLDVKDQDFLVACGKASALQFFQMKSMSNINVQH